MTRPLSNTNVTDPQMSEGLQRWEHDRSMGFPIAADHGEEIRILVNLRVLRSS